MWIWIEIVIVAVFMTVFVKWIKNIRRLEEESQSLQYNIAYMIRYYKEMEKKVSDARKYKHDLANHIQVMEYLLEEEADLLPVLCTMKNQDCKEKGILFHVDLAGIKEMDLDISDMDMISLLQNLLDNAIEASEKRLPGQKREISFSMRKEENTLVIEVKNYYFSDGPLTFQSQKPEKDKHGMGMRIIEEITVKYHGNLKIMINEKESLVIITVRFPLTAGEKIDPLYDNQLVFSISKTDFGSMT